MIPHVNVQLAVPRVKHTNLVLSQNWIWANVRTVLYLCLHFFTVGERLGQNMCRRLGCEKDWIEVWKCDVCLCQGYIAIWVALAKIRLKYKVLQYWAFVCVCVWGAKVRERDLSQTQHYLSGLDVSHLIAPQSRKSSSSHPEQRMVSWFYHYRWL